MDRSRVAVTASKGLLRALRLRPCPHRLVFQTGAWYAITRYWPPWLTFTSVLNATMRLVADHCPNSKITWLPPTQQHGGVESALHLPSCVHVNTLVNRSVFQSALRATKRSRAFGGGKNANANVAHRQALLDYAGGTLDVFDTSLIGQARADSHFDAKDNCGHWCLPGVPDVFGAALAKHLCDHDQLPDPRTCIAE